MRALGRTLAVMSVALAADGIGGAARAISAGDRAPCDKNHVEAAGACPLQTKKLSDEDRVTSWLVERILDLADSGDPVVDFSAADVEAATGVDASTLDLDRIRVRVLAQLHEAARWGEVRLRIEEPAESRAADTDRKTTHTHEAGAGAVPSTSSRSAAPASASPSSR